MCLTKYVRANDIDDAIADGMVLSGGVMIDIHAQEDYWAHLIDEMTRRTVNACA